MNTTLAKPKFAQFAQFARRAFNPPIRDKPFWIVQGMIMVIVVLHYFVDTQRSLVGGAFPAGVPVTLLVIPIGYAALRYGLTGSLATTIWTILLWLPDLMLPHDEGHVGDDLINLTIVLAVAYIFGRRVEAERTFQAQADEASALAFAVEVGYRRLFESNRAPIIVLEDDDVVSEANPAAKELFGVDVVSRTGTVLIGHNAKVETLSGRVTTLANGHDYRLDVVTLPLVASSPRRQVTFEDVTEERSEERRARQFAQLVVQAEEDQRRRLSRELHDEPLQLFLHLARRLELLSHSDGVSPTVAASLEETRNQALEAAARLRTLARDLRPPALDQLGLIPALSSLVADVDDDGPSSHLSVHGTATRLAPEIELGAFRIVQESLRNAVRHANAQHLDVSVSFETNYLALRINDDGVGFDPSIPSTLKGPSESLGLVGMRERARLLGGVINVYSSPQHGTEVTATLPLLEIPSR
ncbi:MAG: PAS domain-containing protein [Acidimicrobiaceae bacterium]|nr:PAS domain-containing protein [Acidimicrobiaceae bacterium]